MKRYEAQEEASVQELEETLSCNNCNDAFRGCFHPYEARDCKKLHKDVTFSARNGYRDKDCPYKEVKPEIASNFGFKFAARKEEDPLDSLREMAGEIVSEKLADKVDSLKRANKLLSGVKVSLEEEITSKGTRIEKLKQEILDSELWERAYKEEISKLKEAIGFHIVQKNRLLLENDSLITELDIARACISKLEARLAKAEKEVVYVRVQDNMVFAITCKQCTNSIAVKPHKVIETKCLPLDAYVTSFADKGTLCPACPRKVKEGKDYKKLYKEMLLITAGLINPEFMGRPVILQQLPQDLLDRLNKGVAGEKREFTK